MLSICPIVDQMLNSLLQKKKQLVESIFQLFRKKICRRFLWSDSDFYDFKGEQHKKNFFLILPLFPHYITKKTVSKHVNHV